MQTRLWVGLLAAGACWTVCGAAAAGRACAVRPLSIAARPTASPLRLRGGAKDDGDDGPTEIGGVKPEPGADEEPEGVRAEFSQIKEDHLAALKSGDLQVSEELRARKKDKNSFAKVANAPCAC